jgi:hypothetical protein
MFHDIQKVSYSSMQRVIARSPYKNSNAYPLGDRKYSNRHFRVNREDGSMTIYYYSRQAADDASAGKDTVTEGMMKRWKSSAIATVHSDNSIEFHNINDNGQTGMLSNMLSAAVTHSSKHQGVIIDGANYYANTNSYIHPGFEGLRISLNDGKALTPYRVFQRRVNRKKADQEMSLYTDFINVYKPMINAMTREGVVEVIRDMSKKYGGVHRLSNESFVQLIKENKFVDAAVYFALIHNIRGVRWLHYQASPKQYELFLKTLHNSLPCKLRETVLMGCDHVFEEKELKAGEEFPSATWGHRIVMEDGSKVNRFN